MISDRHPGLLNGDKEYTLPLYTGSVHAILPQIFGRSNGTTKLSKG
jgi:hypothetical protein